MEELPENFSGDSRQLPEESGDLELFSQSLLLDDELDSSEADEEEDVSNSPSPQPPDQMSDNYIHDFLLSEEYLGNLDGKSLNVATKLRAVLFWLREQKKEPSTQLGWKKLGQSFYTATTIEVQPTQFRKIVTNRVQLLEAYVAGGNDRTRLAGGGRKSSLPLESQRNCVEKIRDAASSGRHVDRSETKRILGTNSDGVVNRFLKTHALREKKVEVSTKICLEQIKTQMRGFHTQAQWLFDTTGGLSADQIVQFDEIALCLSGSLTGKKKYVAPAGEAVVRQSCALRSKTRCATGIFFLTGGSKIPPLVLFKGTETFSDPHARHEALYYTPKACMTSTTFANVVIPHIKRHKPTCRVVVFDYASSHVTPGCRAATVSAGFFDLVIPGNCTSFLQALDVGYFSVYRHAHAMIVDELIRANGEEQYKKLSASDVRLLMAQITTLAHEKMNVDVENLFRSLGYINPAESVLKIPHLTSYNMEEVKLSEEWIERQRWVLAPPTITPTDVEQIAETIAQTPIRATQPKRPREPPVPQNNCTCGHGQAPGRHKRHCARLQVEVSSQKKQQTLAQCLTPRVLSQALRDDMFMSEEEEEDNEEEDDVVDVDRVVVPCGEVVAHEPSQLPGIWDCYQPKTFITTRTLSFLVCEIADLFLGDTILDPLMFEHRMGTTPVKLGMKFVAIVHFKQHYATFAYSPHTRRLCWYDSLNGYYVNERIALYKTFESWIQNGGNEIECSSQHWDNSLQPKGSNDCGIFAINHALHFLSNGRQMGAISRDQFRSKFADRNYMFHYYVHRPEDSLPAISKHVCEACGVALRQMASRTGTSRFFWGCPNLLCTSPRSGPWRMAFD